MLMEIEKLIELAEHTLEEGLEPPEKLARIESYFDAFELFAPRLKEEKFEENELRILLAKHEAVMRMTSSFRDDTSKELRTLRKRGRGIIAYMDILPRKISMITNKKG